MENLPVSSSDIENLVFPDRVEEDEVMVALDMTTAARSYGDIRTMVSSVTPANALRIVLSARSAFCFRDSAWPEVMSAAEWLSIVEELEVEDEDMGEEDDFDEEEVEEDDESADDLEEADMSPAVGC